MRCTVPMWNRDMDSLTLYESVTTASETDIIDQGLGVSYFFSQPSTLYRDLGCMERVDMGVVVPRGVPRKVRVSRSCNLLFEIEMENWLC